MSWKKSALFAFILLAVIGTGLYLSLRHVHSLSNQPLKEKLNLSVYRGEFSSLIWIAENQGYFNDSGLEVVLKEYDSGVDPVKDVLSGDGDIATAGEFVGVRFGFDNDFLKTIAVIDAANTIEIIARRDHHIEKPSDLKGRRIGLKMKSQAEFLISRFLLFSQLSTDDVKLVDLNPSQMAESISNGHVDAVIVWDPHTINIKKALGGNAISWSGQSSQDLYFLLLCRDETIERNPDVIARFLAALNRAENFIDNREQDAKNIVAARLSLDADHLQSVWGMHDFSLKLPQELIIAMEDEARWLIDNNLTEKAEVPNYLNFTYMNGLESIKPDAITITH